MDQKLLGSVTSLPDDPPTTKTIASVLERYAAESKRIASIAHQAFFEANLETFYWCCSTNERLGDLRKHWHDAAAEYADDPADPAKLELFLRARQGYLEVETAHFAEHDVARGKRQAKP